MSEELKTLFPGRDVVVVADGKEESIRISPFPFGQIPKVTAVFSDLAPVFLAAKGDMLFIISEGGESVMKILSIAAKKPREWFDTLSADSGVDLLQAVVEENKEFFEKKMGPKLEKLISSASPKAPEALGEASTQG